MEDQETQLLIERANAAAAVLRERSMEWRDGVAVRGGTYPPDSMRALAEWQDGMVYIGRSMIGSAAVFCVEGVDGPSSVVSLQGLKRWRLLPNPPKSAT